MLFLFDVSDFFWQFIHIIAPADLDVAQLPNFVSQESSRDRDMSAEKKNNCDLLGSHLLVETLGILDDFFLDIFSVFLVRNSCLLFQSQLEMRFHLNSMY